MEDLKTTLITPEEYALKEGISLKTVYNWINSGKLKSKKLFKKTLIKV